MNRRRHRVPRRIPSPTLGNLRTRASSTVSCAGLWCSPSLHPPRTEHRVRDHEQIPATPGRILRCSQCSVPDRLGQQARHRRRAEDLQRLPSYGSRRLSDCEAVTRVYRLPTWAFGAGRPNTVAPTTRRRTTATGDERRGRKGSATPPGDAMNAKRFDANSTNGWFRRPRRHGRRNARVGGHRRAAGRSRYHREANPCRHDAGSEQERRCRWRH